MLSTPLVNLLEIANVAAPTAMLLHLSLSIQLCPKLTVVPEIGFTVKERN